MKKQKTKNAQRKAGENERETTASDREKLSESLGK